MITVYRNPSARPNWSPIWVTTSLLAIHLPTDPIQLHARIHNLSCGDVHLKTLPLPVVAPAARKHTFFRTQRMKILCHGQGRLLLAWHEDVECPSGPDQTLDNTRTRYQSTICTYSSESFACILRRNVCPTRLTENGPREAVLLKRK